MMSTWNTIDKTKTMIILTIMPLNSTSFHCHYDLIIEKYLGNILLYVEILKMFFAQFIPKIIMG